MSIDEETLQVLTELGLTLLEAKVYLALVEAGPASAKTIAKLSKVYQSDIYRITPKLEKIGLIERIISNPTTYKAKPLDHVMIELIQTKNHKITKIEKKTKKILQKYQEKEGQKIPDKTAPDFILVPEGRRHVHRIGEYISRSQKSFTGIGTFEIFMRAIFLDEQIWRDAIKRGVKFRFIMNKPQDCTLVPKLKSPLTINDYFEIRYVDEEPPATLALIDEKDAFIRTAKSLVSPVLWTRNACVINMVKQYLETMWEKTKP